MHLKHSQLWRMERRDLEGVGFGFGGDGGYSVIAYYGGISWAVC